MKYSLEIFLALCLGLMFCLWLWYVSASSPNSNGVRTSSSQIPYSPNQSKNVLQVPLYFHVVNQAPIPADFQSKIIPQFLDIWSQTSVEFVCLTVDQIEISPEIINLLLDQRKSREFAQKESSFFQSYPPESIHVFFIDQVAPTTHGRAFVSSYPFCFVSCQNFGVSLSRTMAHEVSHLFGNHHPSSPTSHDRLMIPGHSGTRLSPEEIQTIVTTAKERMTETHYRCD